MTWNMSLTDHGGIIHCPSRGHVRLERYLLLVRMFAQIYKYLFHMYINYDLNIKTSTQSQELPPSDEHSQEHFIFIGFL